MPARLRIGPGCPEAICVGGKPCPEHEGSGERPTASGNGTADAAQRGHRPTSLASGSGTTAITWISTLALSSIKDFTSTAAIAE